MNEIGESLFELAILGLTVATITWTATREEIFREPREWLSECSRTARTWWGRKCFYMWTCDYCLSHYVAAACIAIANFRLLFDDWRGLGFAWLATVAVANVLISSYSRLRVELAVEKAELKQTEAVTRKAS